MHSAPSSVLSYSGYGTNFEDNARPKTKIVVVDNQGNCIYPDDLEVSDKNVTPRVMDELVSKTPAQKSKASLKRMNMKNSLAKSRRTRKTKIKSGSFDLIKHPKMTSSPEVPSESPNPKKYLSTETQTNPEICRVKKARDMTESARSCIGDSKSQERKRKMEDDINEFERLYFNEQRNVFREDSFNYKMFALTLITIVIFVILMWVVGATLWNTKWVFINYFNNLSLFQQKKRNVSKAEAFFKFISNIIGSRR